MGRKDLGGVIVEGSYLPLNEGGMGGSVTEQGHHTLSKTTNSSSSGEIQPAKKQSCFCNNTLRHIHV